MMVPIASVLGGICGCFYLLCCIMICWSRINHNKVLVQPNQLVRDPSTELAHGLDQAAAAATERQPLAANAENLVGSQIGLVENKDVLNGAIGGINQQVLKSDLLIF